MSLGAINYEQDPARQAEADAVLAEVDAAVVPAWSTSRRTPTTRPCRTCSTPAGPPGPTADRPRPAERQGRDPRRDAGARARGGVHPCGAARRPGPARRRPCRPGHCWLSRSRRAPAGSPPSAPSSERRPATSRSVARRSRPGRASPPSSRRRTGTRRSSPTRTRSTCRHCPGGRRRPLGLRPRRRAGRVRVRQALLLRALLRPAPDADRPRGAAGGVPAVRPADDAPVEFRGWEFRAPVALPVLLG